MVRNKTAAFALTLLMLAPAAGATWLSYGTFEPDTPLDTPSLMWEDAPGIIKNRVYFNAYPKWGDAGSNGAFVNPNVGAAKTRIDLAGPMTWQAILGVWTDCNGDGYVGMAETAVREYKAELLSSTAICPPTTGANGNKWTAGVNNYNGWVTELIPVGNVEYTPNDDKRVYRDTGAMVWGDPGVPDADAAPADAECPAFPLPGDSRNTGGIVRTVDCRGNRGVVALFNTADGQLGTGLGFGSDPRTSGSPLNQPTFGDDDSQRSAVTLQDCSAAPTLTTGDVPVGDDLDNIAILRPLPTNPVNSDPTTWTVPGTLNATRESITVIPETRQDQPPGSHGEGNCNYSDDHGHDFYNVTERNAAINQDGGKRNANWNFFFNTASRGTLPATALGAGSGMAPTDFGVELLGVECGPSSCTQSQWNAPGNPIYTPPVFRGTLQDGNVDGDETTIAAAPHWSFYAFVSSQTTGRGFVLPGGTATQKYGAAQCGSFTSGERHGWNCNSADWYDLADGTNSQDTTARPLAKVGQLYNLRDVDCLDGSTGLGVSISPAGNGESPCA